MYVSFVRLTDVRGFRELEIDLTDGAGGAPRMRTLIIGKNGTCKTSLLRSIAVGLCDRSDANALIAEPIGALVREGAHNAAIGLRMRRGEEEAFRDMRVSPEFGKEAVTSWGVVGAYHRPFVCGYGAGRYGVGPDTGRAYRVADAVYTLFDYRRTLLDPELTLRRLRDFLGEKKSDAALSGIKRVLGLSAEDEIELIRGGGVEILGPTIGRKQRLEGWADGYRMTFSWMLDLYGRALSADSITDEGHVRGIVLIDEIEQHLHPSMQAEILPRISQVFPEVQFFVTTHSPLVAMDAAPEELVVLRREGGVVVRETAVPDYAGYSAEDMLLDDHLFDLGDDQVYAPEMREKVARYRELTAIPGEERRGDQTRELRGLALEIGGKSGPRARESEMVEQLKRLVEKHGL